MAAGDIRSLLHSFFVLAFASLTLAGYVPKFPYKSINSTLTPYSSASCTSEYWLADIKHQGIAPFQNDTGYQIFRNVKDYGAIGDGITDDTAAINRAISDGNRCAPGSCVSSTTTPAVVYFPPGIYALSSDIIDFYYTSLIGHPDCLPTLKATGNFSGYALLNGDPYLAAGLAYGATNVFWREVRNFIFDTTAMPPTQEVFAIHWPTGQATSITNVAIKMSSANGTLHQGLFIEQGSGGFLSDMTFDGGIYGANLGNQQFTSRNWTFQNCVTAINVFFDWGWSFQQMHFKNVSYGVNITSGGTTNEADGGIVLYDSTFENVGYGIIDANNGASTPAGAGTIVLEQVTFANTNVAVQGPNGTQLAGSTGSFTVPAWALGHYYTSGSANYTFVSGPISPNQRPASLTGGGQYYYTRAKPQYADRPITDFLSVRDAGATGDGETDDTAALQNIINSAAAQGKIVYVDGGDYVVSSTIYVPAGSIIVGEPFPVILASGPFFNDINNPQPVIQVGKQGETGVVEWTDTIVSTRGAAAGAILIQWNLASPGPSSSTSASGAAGQWEPWSGSKPPEGNEASGPSGLWDVHTRIGGFAGSNLGFAECPAVKNFSNPASAVDENCIAAFASIHLTSTSRNVYIENCWFWVADHDADDQNLDQITVYAGRGLLVESNFGIWLVGTAVEHHTLYQYSIVDTQDIFAGHIQTETAYYQPQPPVPAPFPQNAAYSDPSFPEYCLNASLFLSPNVTLEPGQIHNECDGWGLRIIDSFDVLVYGAGLYSVSLMFHCFTFPYAFSLLTQMLTTIRSSSTIITLLAPISAKGLNARAISLIFRTAQIMWAFTT